MPGADLGSSFHSFFDAATAFFQHLSDIRWTPFVLALALLLAMQLCRAWAWRNVLRAAYPDRDVPLAHVGAAYIAGVAVNGFTVGRLGDVVKVVLARTHVRGSTTPGIVGTIGVTSLFDLAAAGCTLLAAWQLGAVPSLPLPAPGFVVAAGAAAVLVAATLIGLARARIARLMRGSAQRLACGGAVLRTPGRYAREVAAMQAMAWCARVGVVFFLLHAFHIPASAGDALLVIVLGGVASALPSGPGGAGAQQVAVVLALSQTATAATALSFGVGMQVSISLVNACMGLAGGAFLFRTLRPWAILRHGRALAAAED